MKLYSKIILVFFIVVIAAVLRLWQLGNVPPSPDWDEAALGYNAYSIMLTGKDEYGEFLPFILRSFDDYKPGLYSYFVIPFIKLFGLTIQTVRLPSAIFGVLTVLAAYFLVKELFKKDNIALLSSFLLAISPWHIQFSRIAFESNVGLSFNIFTVLFFLKGFRRPIFLIFAALLAATNVYIYQSEKVFTPLLLLTLTVIFYKDLLRIPKKYLVASVVLGIIVASPLYLYSFTNKDALTRAKGVSIFSDQTVLLKENVKRLIIDRESNNFLGLILDNRRIFYSKSVVEGYLSHFNLNWLFISGDLARHHAPNMGLLYLFELPFLLLGVYSLIFGKFDRKIKWVIFSWFLIAPIPASITSGVPHAVRTLNFLPTFQVFTAIGILAFVSVISNSKYLPAGKAGQIAKTYIKYLIFTLYFLFFIFNFSYYLNQYFVQQNYFESQEWQYGYRQATDEVKKIENKYDKIVVSNQPHLDQSYIFFLFYLQYSPEKYQSESQEASGGFAETHKFGKYEFRPIIWEKEIRDKRILYIGRPEDFPRTTSGILEIYFLDRQPAIKIVEG